MPIPSSALETDSWLRVLVMGPPKAGKSTCAITTSPGPVRVLLCESDSALQEARRRGGNFDFERCMSVDKPFEQMTQFIIEAKADAKAGKVKTVLIDPLSAFCDRLLAQSMKMNLTQNGEEDGRRGYPHYTKRLLHCLDLTFTIPAHVIVITHYLDTGGEIGNGVKKVGEGIVPLIPGSARTRVAAMFNDVLWFDLDKANPKARAFYTAPQGAWGPGCRSLSDKYTSTEANFETLIKLFASEGIGAKKTSNGVKAQLTKMIAKPTAVRR